MTSRVLACVCVAAVAAGVISHGRARAWETRAFGLPATLTSPDAVGRAIASAVADGFDTVLAPVPILSLPLLPATDAHGAAFNSLDEVIRQSRDRRLRVHGLVTIGIATANGELPAARDHVIYQHPEWLMVPRALGVELREMDPRHPGYLGRLLRWTRANPSAALYLSPVDPEAAAYIAASLGRALRRYTVDEITLDLRMPGPEFDFSAHALGLFRTDVRTGLAAGQRRRMDEVEALDPFAWPEEYPAEWARFQRERWDVLLARLRATAAAERPGTVVNATLSGPGGNAAVPAAMPVGLPSASAGSR